MLKITDVRAHKGDSAFLIDDGTTAVLYDTGFAFTGYEVAENIRAVLKDRSLALILLTHSHYDHAAGTPYIRRMYPGAKVVASDYAARIFAKPSARAVMRDLDSKFARTCGICTYEDLIDELSVDTEVRDGDKVEAGNLSFTVVALPGHTRCSVGYYLESEKLLLSSETLGVYDGEKAVVPSYLVGYQMTMDSIRKARQLTTDKILLPHYGILSGKEKDDYLENAEKSAAETCGQILNLLREGRSEAECVEFFKEKFYKGYVRTIYPVDAMELNTSITVSLLRKEFGI